MNHANSSRPMSGLGLSRRRFLGTLGAVAAVGAAADMTGLHVLRQQAMAEELKRRGKRVILLWLAGGASQFETWDPKPGQATGGPFAGIPTSIPGVQISELLPKMAGKLDRTAIIRSMNTQIADHGQGAELMTIGRRPEPGVEYPDLGSIVAAELARADSQVPDFVSMYTATEGRMKTSAGFLGARFNPMFLTDGLTPRNLSRLETISEIDHQDRAALRSFLSTGFARRVSSPAVASHGAAYERVRGLMASEKLFDVNQEPQAMRDLYGPTQFGEQTLVARRLVEAGVPFVKVARGWWDSHGQNFETHRELCADLDQVMWALLTDLEQRGLLDDTLVVTLSEFGRTPQINGSLGRDHFASAWSCTLSGAGILGGSVYGKTSEDGTEVTEGEAKPGDLFATIFAALGIDEHKEYMLGSRPIPIADFGAKAIKDVLA